MVDIVEQLDQQEPEQQDPPSKRRLLYDAVSKDFNLGTYDEFNEKIKNPEKRRLLYDKVGAKYNLGSFDEFNSKLDEQEPNAPKKKVGTIDFANSSLSIGEDLSHSQSRSGEDIPTVTIGDDIYPEDDIIALSKQYKQDKEAVKQPSEMTRGLSQGMAQALPDDEKRAAAEQLGTSLKERGYDPEKIAADFDFPDYVFQSIPKQKLIDDYKNNPQLYEREIATAKWQSKLQQANPSEYGEVEESLTNITNPNIDYNTKRRNVRNIVRNINSSNSEDKDQILRNLSTDLAYFYVEGALSNTKEPENSAAKNLKNISDIVAYDFMSDILPKEANRYRAAFLDDDEIKDYPDAQLQKQIAQKGLAEIRLNMQKSYAREKLNPIEKELSDIEAKGALTTQDELRIQQLVQEGEKYDKLLRSAEAEQDAMSELYPKATYLDANNFAQELLGQKHTGFDWLAIQTGKATDNTLRGIQDLVRTPFANDRQNEINQAEILGNAALNENSAYLNQGNQLLQSFKPELSKELQVDIDAIKNNENLSNKQKLDAVSDLLTSRPSEWRRTPVQGGNTNIGISSLMYGIGGLAADLAPFMLAEMATGGGASAGALRKFTSTFASAAATGFHDAYVEALKNGEENPFSHAMRTTAINSAAMAGANTPEEIRKLLGNKSAIGKLVSGMTDDEIKLALKQEPKSLSAFKKSYESAKSLGKKVGGSAIEGYKTAGKITSFITAGQVANDAINGELKTPIDYAKQAAIETLKFGLFGTALGTIGKLTKPTDVSMANIIEAGRNPQGYELALKTLEKDNLISAEDAKQVRDNIELSSKVVNDPIFKSLSEKKKREYLYNSMVINKSKELAKSLPEKQSQEVSQKGLIASYKNELILNPKTEKQLDSRLAQIEKELTPEKKRRWHYYTYK